MLVFISCVYILLATCRGERSPYVTYQLRMQAGTYLVIEDASLPVQGLEVNTNFETWQVESIEIFVFKLSHYIYWGIHLQSPKSSSLFIKIRMYLLRSFTEFTQTYQSYWFSGKYKSNCNGVRYDRRMKTNDHCACPIG